MATPTHLVRSDNGRIFTYTEQLAGRPDMIEAFGLDEARMLSARRTGEDNPSPAEAGDEDDQGDGDLVISKASKDELEAFARDEFGIELDKRKSVDALRKEVMALADTGDEA